ncbi:Gp37-like protein [Nocardia sp. NPDC004722]
MSAPAFDFELEYAKFVAQKQDERRRRLAPPLVRLWDGDYNLRGKVTRILSASITEVNNDTGMAHLELPMDYWLAEWVVNVDGRDTSNIHLTVDKDGIRWSGRMESFSVRAADDGTRSLVMAFKHDYEELKHIVCYPNPFLPPEFQFPRWFFLFGPSRWALKLLAFFNIWRLQTRAWTFLPDDPLDPATYGHFDQSQWTMVVKPDPIGLDTSMPALVIARMKTVHDASKKIVADAQLTWTFRRYLPGDPPPWPGANLKFGCLVIDLEDKSSAYKSTSFFGDLFGGLIHGVLGIDKDGLDKGIDIVADPNIPPEYYDPEWRGTLAQAPWVIYRDSPHTGIQTADFTFRPATDVGVIAGGHSAPGVNEVIGAAIQTVGDLIAAAVVIPPVGGALDRLLAPLYTDVIAAFGKWRFQSRARKLGYHYYHEKFQEGADRAYSLGWLLAMRSGQWSTRETTSHELVVADGAPFLIGAPGYGHFYLGDRIGSTIRGMPPGRVFVDRVSQIELAWDRERAPSWKITVGQREIQDPAVKAWEQLREIISLIQDLGVL